MCSVHAVRRRLIAARVLAASQWRFRGFTLGAMQWVIPDWAQCPRQENGMN
jgi:hypothetical protein